MAISSERPILGLVEIQEGALIEKSRSLLVEEGLLSPSVVLTALPNDPNVRSHIGSQATYIVEQEVYPNVVFISQLPSHSLTTRHYHHGREYPDPVYETYVCVEG